MGGDHDGDDPMTGTDMEDGDTVSYQLSPEAVIVDLTVTTAQTQDTGEDEDSYAIGDILANIENVMGSEEDDTITGNTSANRLMGGDGNDTLNGGDESTGGDTLMGGAGRDNLNGGAGDDKLMGGAGGDVLLGGDGNDTLTGGAGEDEMTGGTGNDTFVFSPDDGAGHDIINAFGGTSTSVEDKIDLRAFGLDADDLLAPGVIRVFGDNVRIDLRSFGGGTIELGGVTSLASLDADGTLTDDAIDTLSVYDDKDGDGVIDTAAGETDGIFIL